MIGLAVVALLAVVAGGVYVKIVAPMLKPVSVKAPPIGAPRDRVNFFESKGTVTKAAPVTLSFGEAGRVVDVVAVGTETKPGMTLASLDTYADMQRELNDVREREAFFSSTFFCDRFTSAALWRAS